MVRVFSLENGEWNHEDYQRITCVMRGIKKNGLYVLQGKAVIEESAIVQTKQSAEGSAIV